MAGKNHTAAEYLANKAERRKRAQEAANYNQSKINDKIAGLQTALGSNALYALGQDGYKTSDQTTASYRAAIQAYNAYKEAASTGADLSAYERYIAGLIKTAHDQRSFYGQFADQQDYNERYAYPKTVEGKTGAEIEAMMAGTGDAAYLAWLNNNTLPGIDKQIAGNQTLLDTNKAKQDEINNRAYTGQSTPEINAARVARDYWANMTPPGQMIRADRADQVKYNTQQRLYDVYTKAMTGAPMTDEEQKIFDAYVSNNPAWQEHQERMDANLSAQKETQRQIEDKQYKRDVYSGQRETSYADFIEILRDNNSPLMINLNRAGKELDKANAALESFDTEHDAYMATMPVISETGDMSRVWADIDYADDNKGRYNQLVADRDSKQAAFDAAAAAIEDAYNGYIGAAINGVDAGDMYLVEATERLGELQNKQADISEQQYAAAMPSTPEPLGKSRAEAFEEERKKQQGLAELRLDSVLSTAAGDWQAKNSQELYNLTSEQNDIEFQNAILKAKREEVVVRSKYNDLAAAPDFKALSVYDSSNGDSLYQFINNKGTSQEQGAAPAFFTGEVAGAIDVGAANAEASYQAAGYTFLLPEEVQAYNYIYKKDGRDKAQEFLDSFQNIRYLRARSKESEEWAKYADEHGVWASVVSLGTNLASGLMYPVQALDAALNPNHSQFSNLYTANYATQAIRGTVGQNVAEWAGNDLGNTVYQTLMSMGDMLVAMGAGKVAGLATGSGFAKGLTQYIMSSEAGSSTLLNSLQRNIAPNKAVGMSIASAMIEALTEKYSIDALLKEPKKAALYIAKNMLTEGSEEAASNIANTLVDLIVNADQAELAQAIAEKGYAQALTEYAQSVGLDAIMGAISGGVMSGGKVTVGNTIKTANETANAISTGKQINKNQTYKQLHDLAVAMPEGSKARQLAWKSGEKVTALKAGKVYHALMQDLDERGAAAVRNSMVADIKGRMRELGATGDLTAVAEAVQKLWMGEKLSAREQDMIATSPVAMRVQRELLDNTDEWATKAKSSANSAYETAAYNKQRTVSQLASQGYKVAEDKAATKGLAENATTTYDNAEQEKTLNTAAYTPQNVALTVTKVVEADGKLMFEAEQDGQTATYAPSELDFDSYNTAYMGRVMVSNHMSAEAANTMLQFYGKGGVTGPAYVQGFAVAYNAGRIGTGMAYANNSLYGRALSGDARKAAYDAGLKDAKNAPKKAPVARRKGNVTIDKDIDYKSLTKGQKAAINAMREIAPRLGIDVEFFASQADESGSYKDWENGSYKDGVIRLDINAGRDDVKSRAQFAILRTASHELTHFIKDASKDLYAELQEFVVTHLIEGGKSMEQLIADKKAREKRKMTDPEAIEEIVADACEMMLRDSKAIQTLAEENATLFEKMAKWLRDFFERVRKAFEGVSYAHAEAGALMKKDADGILHYIDGLQELWDRALVDAAHNVQGAQTTQEAIKTVEKFAMREPIEQKRNLIAVHNLTEDNLLNALNLGGLPMPSLAIVKAETGHEKYGPISLLFGKETIDPAANKGNKVYGADAWTPTAPAVEYKVNEKADMKVGKKISELSAKVANGVFAFNRYSVTNNEDAISENAASLAEKLARNAKVKAAYAAEMGIEIPVEMKKKVFNRHGNEALREFIDAVGSKERLMDLVVEAEDNGYVPEAEAKIIYGIIEKIVRKDFAKFEGKRPADVIEKRVQDRLEKLTQRYELVRFLEDAYKMQSDPNATSEEVDYFATEDNLQEAVDNKDVIEWLKPMLEDVVGEAGIRNKVDWYTPSGNRRSFKALHDPYTLENIVKAMKGNQHARGQNAHSSATGIGSITSKEYKNIKEIKADSGRLGAVTEEEYKRATMAIDRRISELWGKIVDSGAGVSRYDDELLVDIARDVTRGQMTAAKIAKSFKNIASVTVSNEIAEETLAIFRDAAELPTEYFEAKPARVVNFDEIRLAVLPDNVRHDLYKRLEDAGVPVETYETGNEQQRLELLNSRPDTKFSTREAAYSQAIDVRARFRASYNRHPVGLWFRDEALMGALDEGDDEKPNELELMIQQLQPRVLAGDDVSMVYASNEDGETKIAIIEKAGKMEYDIVDVYRLDTIGYTGRTTAELIDKFEKAVAEYGKSNFDRWFESFGGTHTSSHFSKYDRHNRRYVQARPDARGEGREDTGAAGTQRDGRRAAGGGTKSPWGLKSDLPESVRSLWPEYKQRIRDGNYFPKNVKPGQYSFVVLYDYLLVQKMQSDGRFVVEAVYEENDLAERDVYAIGRVFDEVYDNAAERTFDSMAEVQSLLDGLKDRYGESFVSRRRNQARDADTISEREILANADPDAFKQGMTAGFLREYQKAYRELEGLMTKLADYREKASAEGLSAEEKAKADNRVALAEKQVQRQEEKLAKLEAKPVFEKVLESERKSLTAYVSGRTTAQLAKEIERYESKMTALSGYEKEAREQARKARRLARSLYKERNRWIREGDALKLAQNLVKQNSSALKAGDLAPRIRSVFEDMANGKNMAAAVAELNRIAGEVVSSAKAYEESSVAYVGQYLKGKTIKLTDAQKQEAKSAYGSVADFKRQTKLNISENGVDLTKLWNELADLNPVLFDVQETEGGMVYALAAAMEAAQPEAYNPFAGDEAAAAEQIATDLLDEGVGMEIRLPAIEKQRKHYQEVIAKLRSANAEKLALANQRGRERLERYKEKTKDTLSRSELRDRIKHDVKALNRLLLNETDVKHIPEELKGAMAQFLRVFADDSSVFAKGMLDDLRYAYDKISDRAKGDEDISQLASAYDEGMAEVISDLRSLLDGRRLSELNIDETRTVRDIVQHLLTLVKHQNNLFFEGRRASVEAAGKEMIAEAEEHGPAKGNKLTREVRNLLREGMMTPAYFFKQLGGVGKRLYEALKEGESTYGLNVKKSADYFAEKAKQYNYDKWRLGKPMTMTTQQGHEITLTREQALGLYATWKRENSDNGQNAKHLSEGGFVYEDAMSNGKGGKITVNTNKPNKMSEADMQKVAAWLTAEQKAFADDLVRYMSVDMAALGNKVSMAMYGVKKFTEETYYPYQTSLDYRYTPLGQGAATNDQRLKHSSFTRRTQQHANNPIIASDFTTVWANHVNHMILYSAMCLPLENVNRIYNYRYTDENGEKHSVKAALKDAYGEQAAKYIEQLMNDLNGGVQIRGTGWVNTLVSKFKRNAVFASLSVAIQQPSSVVRAMAIVDPKYFGNGIAMDGGWDELTKYSGVAVIKEMGGFDTSTGYGAQAWILGNRADTKLEKVSHAVDKVGGFLPEKMDRLAWTAIWRAIKAETRANTDLVVGSEEFLQAAAKRFDEVISYTQVYDSVLAKSQMMRNPALNAITTFMSEPTLTYNMLLDAFTHRGKADSVSIPRAMTAFVATAAVNAMLKALVTAARDDDEEKSYIEKYLGKSLESFINDLNPLNMIPLARDMVSILQGYDVERPDMSLISDLVNGFNRGKKAFVDGDIYNGIKEIAGPVGAFFNLPVKNVWRDAEAIVGLATRPFMPTTEDGIRYSLLEALPGYGSKASDYYSRRLDAMLAGDDRELESLTIHLESGMGKSAKAIKTQTKTELGKRYKAGKVSDVIATDILMDYFAMDADEAYWQLKEWREKEAHGDDEEYTFSRTADLENALLSGKTSQIEAAKQELTSDGGYTAKEVVTKTKAAIKNLYVDGKITFDQAAKMLTEQLEDYQNTEKPSKKRERQKEIENDLYWIEKEWAYAKANKDNDAAEPWSDYMTLHTAIEGGKGQKAAIKELLDHGKTKSGIASSIKARWQDEYVKLYNTNRKAALQLQSQILDAYVAAGYSRTEQAAKIKKEWFK